MSDHSLVIMAVKMVSGSRCNQPQTTNKPAFKRDQYNRKHNGEHGSGMVDKPKIA